VEIVGTGKGELLIVPYFTYFLFWTYYNCLQTPEIQVPFSLSETNQNVFTKKLERE